MDESLREEQKEGMLPIARRANLNAWGARPSGDRIKIAGMQAKTALFCRDEKELKMVLKVIEGEIKLVAPTERGIQVDYSFHHRVDRVNNTLSYGLGYVDAFAEWASNVNGTRYAFSEKAVRMAVDYYLDGICKQMVYGRIEDPGIQNRDITRRHGRLVFSSVTPTRLMKVTDYRHEELENVVKAREGKDYIPASFAKFFWQSEHFVFQRPSFYTSVRMFSSRNRNMEEPYNGEGLKNHFRGDGTNYLSLNGEEYVNLAPVYDWSCIPGATTVRLEEMPSEKEIQKKGEMDFVGGVTDGLYGAAAFDFSSPHNPLHARKSWFFFDDMYVCLGTGIESASEYPIVTTINQCRLSGEVVAGTGISRDAIKPVFQSFYSIKDESQYLYAGRRKGEYRQRELICRFFRTNSPDIYRQMLHFHKSPDYTLKSVANMAESNIMNPICGKLMSFGLHPFRLHDAIYLTKTEFEVSKSLINIDKEIYEKINENFSKLF